MIKEFGIEEREDGRFNVFWGSENWYYMDNLLTDDIGKDNWQSIVKNSNLEDWQKEFFNSCYVSIIGDSFYEFVIGFSGSSDVFEVSETNLITFKTRPLVIEDIPENIKENYKDSMWDSPEVIYKFILPSIKSLKRSFNNCSYSIQTPDISAEEGELWDRYDDFVYEFNHPSSDLVYLAPIFQRRIENYHRVEMILKERRNYTNLNSQFTPENNEERDYLKKKASIIRSELESLWKQAYDSNYRSLMNSKVLNSTKFTRLSKINPSDFVPLEILEDISNERQCEYCGNIEKSDNIWELDNNHYDVYHQVCEKTIKWNREDFNTDKLPQDLIDEAKRIEEEYK